MKKSLVGTIVLSLMVTIMVTAWAIRPVELFGKETENGDVNSDEQPIPVEPDGGIGDTPDDQPIPVEPDGGIGNTP